MIDYIEFLMSNLKILSRDVKYPVINLAQARHLELLYGGIHLLHTHLGGGGVHQNVNVNANRGNGGVHINANVHI